MHGSFSKGEMLIMKVILFSVFELCLHDSKNGWILIFGATYIARAIFSLRFAIRHDYPITDATNFKSTEP